MIYGTVDNGNTSATAGVQKNDTTFTQYFLQRHRWRGYWRTKLHAARLRHADTDAYRRRAQLHAKFVPRAHRLFRYHRAYAVAERDPGRARRDGG